LIQERIFSNPQVPLCGLVFLSHLWHHCFLGVIGRDILLVVLAFWCVHSAKGVGLLAAFVLGLLMDVHDTNVLGRHALYYVLVIYAVMMIRQHIVQFSVLAHFVSILPVFVVAAIPGRIFEAWLAGVWSGWGGVWSGFITSLLWFVVDILFKFFSHGHHDEQKLN
jgi:rod shape-determining protein MreD